MFSDSYEGKKFKLNDVIPSPNGDLIGGSAHLDICTLFNFKKDGNVEIIDDGLGLCNGMGFSPDLKNFYSTDSLIDRYSNGIIIMRKIHSVIKLN